MKEIFKKELAKAIRSFNKKGWSPATSTNYSFRREVDLKTIVISKSGVDKAFFSSTDFIEVDLKGLPLPKYKDKKPSAETLIHCTLYELFPESRVVLHSHSIYSVLCSMKLKEQIHFQGYEVQKGFTGQTSHKDKISIPILENSQNMDEFSDMLRLRRGELTSHCFLIKGHGTYAWGNTLFEAKRHLESIEYLSEMEWKLMNSK